MLDATFMRTLFVEITVPIFRLQAQARRSTNPTVDFDADFESGLRFCSRPAVVEQLAVCGLDFPLQLII